MRRVIVGLVVLVVVVAGLPAVVSAGEIDIEHPPIDCYAGNGFNSAFVGDVDWGFPCVAYDGESVVAETSVTKLYPLWDGSRKLVAYFYGDDPGLSSGDECRLPDGTITTETWVHRWFWKTTVVCKAPPAPECSTTLPSSLVAYAYTDVNSNVGQFDEGEDIWIAAVQVDGPSYTLLLNCYPLGFDFDTAGFGSFAERELPGVTPTFADPNNWAGYVVWNSDPYDFDFYVAASHEYFASDPVAEPATVSLYDDFLNPNDTIRVSVVGIPLGDPSDEVNVSSNSVDTPDDHPFINVVIIEI